MSDNLEGSGHSLMEGLRKTMSRPRFELGTNLVLCLLENSIPPSVADVKNS
jgi:hypothetical protein